MSGQYIKKQNKEGDLMALFKKDKEFYERFFGGFLLSINYMHLAEALDLTDMRMDIQENLKDFFKKNDYDDEMQKRIIIETIYDYMLEKQHISKARINEDNLIKKLEEHYYYYLHFYDIGKWDEIKKQMIHEIKTKKVTSYYLLEKYFNQLIDYYFPGNNFAKADSNILLKSIEQIIENQSAQLDGYVYKYVVEDAIYGFKGDSLNFEDRKSVV